MKQLFLYLTAEYETPNNKLNQVREVYSWQTCRASKVDSNTMLWAELALLEQRAVWSGPACAGLELQASYKQTTSCSLSLSSDFL